MVECLTRDRGVVVLSLTGGTALVLYPLLSTGSTQAFKKLTWTLRIKSNRQAPSAVSKQVN